MRGKAVLVAALSLCLAMTSCGATGECMGNNGEKVILKGTVRVVGNEPFARLVLTVPDPGGGVRPRNYDIKGPLAAEIGRRHQGKIITIEGRLPAQGAPGGAPCIEADRILKIE
jgi:hypothetical protein